MSTSVKITGNIRTSDTNEKGETTSHSRDVDLTIDLNESSISDVVQAIADGMKKSASAEPAKA